MVVSAEAVLEKAGEPSPADGVKYGSLSFAPRVSLDPEPISFEQYVSWAPEAKFEWVDGRPYIGGERGSRELL